MKVPYPASHRRSVPARLRLIYNVTGGHRRWNYKQRITGSTTCDYAGARTYTPHGGPGPAPGLIPVLTLSTTRRRATPTAAPTVGLAINALADSSAGGGLTCTDSTGKVTKGTSTSIAKPLDCS